MNDVEIVTLTGAFDVLLAGGLLAIMPLVSRRGLLFGAYVGEEADAGAAAAGLKGSWYAHMGALIAACLVVVVSTGLAGHPMAAIFVSLFLEISGIVAIYVRHHNKALALARPRRALAAASLTPAPAGSLVLPAAILCVNFVLGIAVTIFTARHYGSLPDVVPIHFGGSGVPDGWAKKSFASVMAMPIGALFMGSLVAGIGLLTAGAKRSVRADDTGISLVAQQRYRNAITRFLSGLSLVMTLMLTGMSYDAVEVGLGNAPAIGGWLRWVGGAVGVWAVGGTLYLILRYGQGGARLEATVADRPLTNGLADESHWKWGIFYFNREDPSILIEKRFGVGYTFNFGNPWGIVLTVVLFALIGAIILLVLSAHPVPRPH